MTVHIFSFLAVSLIYMGTAVYLRYRYPRLDRWAIAAFLFIGSSLFVAINVRFLLPEDLSLYPAIIVIVGFLLGWAAGVISVLKQIKTTKSLRQRLNEI